MHLQLLTTRSFHGLSISKEDLGFNARLRKVVLGLQQSSKKVTNSCVLTSAELAYLLQSLSRAYNYGVTRRSRQST
jgi:hypothetical protein